MKLEEILPALREGKKIRKNSWWKECYIQVDENKCIIDEKNDDFILDGIYEDDWEIIEEPKEKIKYYPALIKFTYFKSSFIHTKLYETNFKDIDEAKNYFKYTYTDINCEVIRLITEIPELIEEKEE